MKKYLLILYILVLTLTLGAAGSPTSVSITLTTSVPGYLLHGFLDSPGSTAFGEASPTVDNAFDPAGATLNYGIKTNAGLPLIVKATIHDFAQQADVPQPATISISQVKVGSEVGSTILPYNSTNTYSLLTLEPVSGKIFYPYTLTVYANQMQVQNSPRGEYKSTVEINIGIND